MSDELATDTRPAAVRTEVDLANAQERPARSPYLSPTVVKVRLDSAVRGRTGNKLDATGFLMR